MTDFQDEIGLCMQTLQRGGVIVFPAATGWCFGCDATDDEAVGRMLQLARAGAGQCEILVADERDILRYTAATDLALFDYLEQQGAPTSVLCPDPIGIAETALRYGGNAAMRMVQDAFSRHLVRRLRRPVATVPAELRTASALQPGMQGHSNAMLYVVPHHVQPLENKQPATLIRWQQGRAVPADQ